MRPPLTQQNCPKYWCKRRGLCHAPGPATTALDASFDRDGALPPRRRLAFHACLHAASLPHVAGPRTYGTQPVDGVAVGRGLSRRGLEPSGLERPDQAGRHGAAGSHVETGPTGDDASRPGVSAQQPRRDRLIRLGATCPTLALGGPDDVWWSRLAPPSRSPGADDTPFRLAETTRLQADPDAQALAGDGCCRPPTAALRWRFVHGRPVSQVTGDDRAWVAQRLVPDGKQAWRLIWDNASWPLRNRVRTWLKPPHQRAKPAGGGRLLVGHLPSQSPGLHPIEPRGVHGTRAIVEPERPLTAPAVIERVCADDGGENLTPMTQQVC
jgi:hypothetical protein